MMQEPQVDLAFRLNGIRPMAMRACAVEDFLALANAVTVAGGSGFRSLGRLLGPGASVRALSADFAADGSAAA